MHRQISNKHRGLTKILESIIQSIKQSNEKQKHKKSEYYDNRTGTEIESTQIHELRYKHNRKSRIKA